jgi:streptogramin lyase
MISIRYSLLVAALLGAPAVAQLDVYWQASRWSKELHRINACGEVDLKVDLSTNNFPLNKAPELRKAYLAPNGKVWVINHIVNHFTILDGDGKNLRNIPLASAGFPAALVFDKAGLVYMALSKRKTGFIGVEVYDATAKLVRSFAMPTGNPIDITMDSDGNVWCAHRMEPPPSKITKIDTKTNTMTDYPFPTATASLGGVIVADYQGLLKKSTLWCIGDRSSDLLNFGVDGKHIGTYNVDPNSTTIAAMTIDHRNNIWIGNFRDANIFHFDTTQKKVVRTLQNPPNTLGLAIDNRGRLLATVRVSYQGPQPSLVRRFNTTTFAPEMETTVGIGAGSAASSGFHHALVVDPLGDADKDKDVNFSEVTNLSNAYDDQSTSNRNLVVSGENKRTGKVTIALLGKTGSTAVVGLATKLLATPICIPAWDGCLRVDPSSLLPWIFTRRVPDTSLVITIPNDPALVGFVVRFQALYDLGGPKPSWSNVDCVRVYK